MRKIVGALLLITVFLNFTVLQKNIERNFRNSPLFEQFCLERENSMEILPLRAAIDASVHINASDIIRELPSGLYGSNINFIDNGSGILNPTSLDIYDNIAERFAAINLSTIRFPGGSLSERYNWWYGIGPQASRPMGINAYSGGTTDNNYGIDEHYDFCQEIGAKPTITVNFGNGTALTAANWWNIATVKSPSRAQAVGLLTISRGMNLRLRAILLGFVDNMGI